MTSLNNYLYNSSKSAFSILLILICNLALSFIKSPSAFAQVGPNEIAASRAHINKGNYLLTHQQFQGALTEYEQALASDPSSSVAKENIGLVHNNWGIYYFHQKKYDEARNEWNESLKLNPNDRNAKNNLAILKNLGPRVAPAAPAATSHDVAEPASTTMVGAEKTAPIPTGSQTAKEDNRGVVILSQPSKNSTSKLDSGYGLDGDAISTSGASIVPPAKNPSASGASIIPSANNAAASTGVVSPSTASNTSNTGNTAAEPTNANTSIYQNSMKPNTTGPTFADTVPSGAAVPTPIYAAPPASSQTVAATTTPPPSPAAQSQSLESTLGRIEVKVYGMKKDLPIVQRLEKLEQDTNSKTGSGSIADRIQSLAKTYGL